MNGSSVYRDLLLERSEDTLDLPVRYCSSSQVGQYKEGMHKKKIKAYYYVGFFVYAMLQLHSHSPKRVEYSVAFVTDELGVTPSSRVL